MLAKSWYCTCLKISDSQRADGSVAEFLRPRFDRTFICQRRFSPVVAPRVGAAGGLGTSGYRPVLVQRTQAQNYPNQRLILPLDVAPGQHSASVEHPPHRPDRAYGPLRKR